MKKTKPIKDKRVKRSLFSIRNFFLFFMLAAFIVTVNILMFISLNNLDLNVKNSSYGALMTFGNVVFCGLMFSIFDNIRKKITIERPIRRLLEATARVKAGDFSVRIMPFHKTHKDEFDAIIDDFNEMTEELSSVETLRSDFISNVSHELKTPLAVIQNYAVMLQDPEIDENQRKEYTNAIAHASRDLSGLITNILKLNKLENQQIYSEATVYNLSEQLCECLLNFEDIWEKKNIDIDNDIEDGVMIQADENLMQLVWNNLFSNALKFTPDCGKVAVSLKKNGNKVSVSVKDTGCGMSEEVQKHMFEKFYQGDTSHSSRGNGLGLALVRRLMDIVDGEIAVESEEGKESTFTVTLRCE